MKNVTRKTVSRTARKTAWMTSTNARRVVQVEWNIKQLLIILMTKNVTKIHFSISDLRLDIILDIFKPVRFRIGIRLHY